MAGNGSATALRAKGRAGVGEGGLAGRCAVCWGGASPRGSCPRAGQRGLRPQQGVRGGSCAVGGWNVRLRVVEGQSCGW